MEIVNRDEVGIKNKNMLKKEDLKRYYIDEKKSMVEISEIYKCNWRIIKRRLKKYGISIRPYEALLADDNETLNSKREKGEISNSEYHNKLAEKRGYIDHSEYINEWVKSKGFENINEYNKEMQYKRGKYLPMSENKECSLYLGVYIAERILPLLFENVEKMPDGNPGFDFICSNGYKIDVKSACLTNTGKRWTFKIKKNKIADYFFMVSFDNRDNLNVMHIWLVKGDAVIEKTKTYSSEEFIFNEKYVVTINKGNKALERWKKYEKTDILEEAQKLCNIFKEKCDCKVDHNQLGD